MDGLTLLSILFSLLALTGTSPFWLKLLTRYFYSSGVSFFIKESRHDTDPIDPGEIIPYENAGNLGISIIHRGDKHMKYSIIIHSGLWIDIEEQRATLFDELEIENNSPFSAIEVPNGTTSSIVATNGLLSPTYEEMPGYSSVGSPFPFSFSDGIDAPRSRHPFRVAIVPEVPLSEFGFPDFFGSAQLKPIIHNYTIVDKHEKTKSTGHSNET